MTVVEPFRSGEVFYREDGGIGVEDIAMNKF